MKVLFIHQNFPGQFKYLAPALARRGDDVRALGITGREVPGVRLRNYLVSRSNTKGVHPWAQEFEAKMLRGQACGEAMERLREDGFVPDLVVVHPGWGESLCIRDVFPEARQLHFVEWYYRPYGSDVNYDDEFADPAFSPSQVRAKNAANLLALEEMDAGYAPTVWQRDQLPERDRHRVEVIHDGVNTAQLKPDRSATITFQRQQLSLGRDDELVTFVNRNLEPVRGWHVFARSLPRLMALRPRAHFAIIGDNKTSYGPSHGSGKSWRDVMLAELGDRVDMDRIHFLGRIPYSALIRLFQASSCHVYLTVPFVLSWSMLEAMAVEALVVASDTPPVREVIEDGVNGLLTPFHDADALAERVASVLAEPQRYERIRTAARQTIVDRYDLAGHCLPRQVELVDRVARKGISDVISSPGQP